MAKHTPKAKKKGAPSAPASGSTPTPTTIPPIIRLPLMLQMTGWSRTTIYRKMDNGEFPKQVKLGRNSHSMGWKGKDFEKWVDSLGAE
jgi:prophage regulatory protein